MKWLHRAKFLVIVAVPARMTRFLAARPSRSSAHTLVSETGENQGQPLRARKRTNPHCLVERRIVPAAFEGCADRLVDRSDRRACLAERVKSKSPTPRGWTSARSPRFAVGSPLD